MRPSSRNLSSTPQANAPCAPPPCRAMLTIFAFCGDARTAVDALAIRVLPYPDDVAGGRALARLQQHAGLRGSRGPASLPSERASRGVVERTRRPLTAVAVEPLGAVGCMA